MPDFAQMEAQFQTLGTGSARLAGIRSAIREADAWQALRWQFRFRYDYLKESVFSGDRYYAMIVFPELTALYDDHPKLQEDEQVSYYLLIAFKWIVEAAPEFPQISREEIEGYFRMFKQRLLEQGKSLSIYYMKRCLFYLHVDRDLAAANFYRFLDAPLDDISDGKALWYDQQAMFYLSVGQEEAAKKAAKPIFEGRMKSNALPQATYHDFIRYYLRHGRYEEALHDAAVIEGRVNGDPYYLDILGTLLSLAAVTDPAHGAALFNRNYPLYLASKNPFLTMCFAIGSAHLLDALPDPSLLRVPHSAPICKAVQDGDIRSCALSLRESASELAARFDARNGTQDFMNMLGAHPIK